MTTKQLVSIIALILVLGGGWFFFGKQAIAPPPPPSDSIQESAAVPETPIDTSDWKTYRNEEIGIEFKYPSKYKVTENGGEYESVKMYSISIRREDEVMFLQLDLTGRDRSIPEEGGCWSYVGSPVNPNQTLKELEQIIKEKIPHIELVRTVHLKNVNAVDFYCIGAYGSVFSRHRMLIPFDNHPYTNINVYGPVVAMSNFEDIDGVAREEWESTIERLRESVSKKDFLNDTNIAEQEALFQQTMDSFIVD